MDNVINQISKWATMARVCKESRDLLGLSQAHREIKAIVREHAPNADSFDATTVVVLSAWMEYFGL